MRERLEAIAWMIRLAALFPFCLAACVNPGLMAKIDRMDQRLIRIEARQVTADDPSAMDPLAALNAQPRRAP